MAVCIIEFLFLLGCMMKLGISFPYFGAGRVEFNAHGGVVPPDQLACNTNLSLNNCMPCMLTQQAKCLLLFAFHDRRYRPFFKQVLKSRRVTKPNGNINYARLMTNALALQIRLNVDE